jgi:hypothetical protein
LCPFRITLVSEQLSEQLLYLKHFRYGTLNCDNWILIGRCADASAYFSRPPPAKWRGDVSGNRHNAWVIK